MPEPDYQIGQAFCPHISVCKFNVGRAIMADTRLGLSNGQKLLLLSLICYAGRNGLCYPSHATLAESVGRKDRRAIAKDIAVLLNAGLLRREERMRRTGGQTSNIYVFLYHRIYDWYRAKERDAQQASAARRGKAA
jgi:hypothetical protein